MKPFRVLVINPRSTSTKVAVFGGTSRLCSEVLMINSGDPRALLIHSAMAYQRVSFIARVFVYEGEDEKEALRDAALRVLSGEEEVASVTR